MSKDLFFKMRQDEVAHLLTECEEGNVSALSAYANLKRTKDLLDEAIKQVEPMAQDEASLYPDKTFDADGFYFEKRNGSTRYSYSHIPDVIELNQKLKEVQERSKQAYLAMQKKLLTADENGEDVILPKVSYTKDVLIVKK